MNKLTYLWSQGMVDKIAEKVAEEPMENVELIQQIQKHRTRPKHVIDEEKVDEEILNRHDRRQMEMFDDPYMNWSGQR
jgi:hypothetical protein